MTQWTDVTYYDLAKDILIPTGAIIAGFAGIIYSIRRGDGLERQRATDEYKQETNSFKTALIAELQRNLDSARKNQETLFESPGKGVKVPTAVISGIYHGNIGNMPRLTPEQIQKVSFAYDRIDKFPQNIAIEMMPLNYETKYMDVYLMVSSALHDHLRDLLAGQVASIEAAIAS